MAEQKTAAYLPGESPEIVEANTRYQTALKKLTDSLDQRKNRFFDPEMLALAQGFLAPTKTGSFFESLGNAAGKYGAAQEATAQENRAIAEQELGLAGQNIELMRMRSRDEDLKNYLNPQQRSMGAAPLSQPPKQAPQGGALPDPAAAPQSKGALPQPETPQGGALPPALSGFGSGIPVAPPNPNFMSARDYVRLNRFDNKKSPSELIKEGQELEQKRFQTKENGVLDLSTGMFYQFPTGKTEKVQIYGKSGTYEVDAKTAALLSFYAANNDPRYYEVADRVVNGPARPQGGKNTEIRSSQQIIIDEARARALSENETKQEIESRNDFVQKSKDADETLATASVFRKFASDPSASKMFGILKNDKITSQIATLVSDAIKIGNFNIGLPQVEEVMRNSNLNPAEQAKYRTFLMFTTQMQLQMAKYMKGAVSDFEQRTLSQAGINANDTPETIRTKADILTLRAQFDRRVAKAFKSSKMEAEKFKETDEYQKMKDDYIENLTSVASGLRSLQPRSAQGAQPKNQPSTGFIRDSQTGVIRRKREGE